jgi:hypothetical protein
MLYEEIEVVGLKVYSESFLMDWSLEICIYIVYKATSLPFQKVVQVVLVQCACVGVSNIVSIANVV